MTNDRQEPAQGKGSDGIPIEKKFAVLSQIVRAQHFAWREACLSLFPGSDPVQVVLRMWEVTGRDTAKAYLKRIDRAKPLAAQVAALIVESSRCMEEDARLETDAAGAYVRHHACPWLDWHKRAGALAEDRPGCDRWFESTLAALNEKLGSTLRFRTQKALPDGDACCLRRIWEEKPGRRDG